MYIIKIKYLDFYRIEVEFENGTVKIADFEEFLFGEHSSMTTQFRDIDRFKTAYIELGHLTWEDGQMDISAHGVYNNEFTK